MEHVDSNTSLRNLHTAEHQVNPNAWRFSKKTQGTPVIYVEVAYMYFLATYTAAV